MPRGEESRVTYGRPRLPQASRPRVGSSYSPVSQVFCLSALTAHYTQKPALALDSPDGVSLRQKGSFVWGSGQRGHGNRSQSSFRKCKISYWPYSTVRPVLHIRDFGTVRGCHPIAASSDPSYRLSRDGQPRVGVSDDPLDAGRREVNPYAQFAPDRCE